ncbi:hypothetical protein PN4B1_17140 [Paenibacillus naphthalenovorans]|uniref:hypothetical protein n=1 Tax=Paenibacillus naphthalenovorans TaxID=162209 RepID=UPI0010B37D78|nr:hypothetical protein [Paenibacillus naphthalenovorans]GCL71809.1 hypothetical protein PN4B1_17140 [Paenibacillus naphthalenovorans]
MAGNVVALRKTNVANTVAKKQKDLSVLEKALAKDKSGLNFAKIATGDITENQRLKFRQYQEAMRL